MKTTGRVHSVSGLMSADEYWKEDFRRGDTVIIEAKADLPSGLVEEKLFLSFGMSVDDGQTSFEFDPGNFFCGLKKNRKQIQI